MLEAILIIIISILIGYVLFVLPYKLTKYIKSKSQKLSYIIPLTFLLIHLFVNIKPDFLLPNLPSEAYSTIIVPIMASLIDSLLVLLSLLISLYFLLESIITLFAASLPLKTNNSLDKETKDSSKIENNIIEDLNKNPNLQNKKELINIKHTTKDILTHDKEIEESILKIEEKPIIKNKPKRPCPQCKTKNGLKAKYCFICGKELNFSKKK